MKVIEGMESETNSNKRKRLEEESDEEKPEKRQRLDDTFEKLDEVLRNKSTALSKDEKHTLDKIDDKESNQTEQDVSYRCVSVTESKNEKNNAVFINTPANADACSLPIIESDKEDGATEMTASAQSLDSKDVLTDEEVRDSDARCSSTNIPGSKNDDDSKNRDTKAEDDDLGIESDTEKGGDIKFDTCDAVQEKEARLDNCVDHQIKINHLEEKGKTNEGLISPGVLEESNVQIEQRDVSDANLGENECKDSVFTTESENQIVTSETSGQEDNAIDEERYLYRLLKPGESLNHGIRPKNVFSNTSIDDHVASGSCEGVNSKYISCSKTRSGIDKFASIIRRDSRSQLRYIVKIDKTKLGEDCKIYDLTEESVRTEHLYSERAKRHSLRFDEVLLAPPREIPVECFTKVATVQHGTKNWNDDTL